MKRLRYMRHLQHRKGNVFQSELDRVQKEPPEGNYTDIFYGPLYRTMQTALAVVAALGVKARVHETISEIGDGPAVDKALDILDEYKGETQPFSLERYVEPLKKMFSLMPENGFGLAVGHGPMIRLAAISLSNLSPGRKIGPIFEGESIVFSQDDTGRITVES